MFAIRKYDKEFKGKAVKLSDEIGVKQAAAVAFAVTRRFLRTNAS